MDAVEQAISNSISGLEGSESAGAEDTGDVGEGVGVETGDESADSGAEAAQSSEDGDVNGSPVTDPAAKDATTASADSDELLTTEFKGQKNNRLPYPRVKAIVENARRKEAEIHQTKIREMEQQIAASANQVQALRIAEENPEQFLTVLAQADPRYKKILSRVFDADPAQPAGRTAGVGKPEPDMVLADGTLIYSAEAQERLADWKAEQRVKELEARYEERFGPMEQEHRTNAHIRAAVPRVQAQIAQAETWPGFTENKAGILAALKADRNLTLEGAYMKVALPKLQANRDEMRRSLMAEMQQRPRAASTGVPSGAPSGAGASQGGGDAIEMAIRESVAALKK